MTVRIGVIGTGEAGLAVAVGLRAAGAGWVGGHDSRFTDSAFVDQVRSSGVEPVAELAALARASDVLICLTSARSALTVAAGVTPHLRPGHIYSDWNSTSPDVQRRIADQITPTGARFADGAVMAAVPPHGHAVPVLLSGDGAAELGARLDGLGMQLEVLGSEPGTASAVKMFRSLLIKGLEALVIEFLAGAERFGATARVLDSMTASLPADWTELAVYLVGRSVAHGERRAEELRQVATMLRAAGLDPVVAEAGARRLQWLADGRPPAQLADRGLQPILDWLHTQGEHR